MGAVARVWDARQDERDRVFHRARATIAAGTPLVMTLVDVSPGGFMARSDAALAEGDVLTVELPIVGRMPASVRWVLGGRVGCRFEPALPAGLYGRMLHLLQR